MVFNSISKKVMSGYTVILILVLAMAVVLYQATSQINAKNSAFVDNTLPMLRSIEGASTSLSIIEIDAFALYGTTLDLSSFNENFGKEEKKLNQLFSEINSVSNTQEFKPLAIKVYGSVTSLSKIMARSSIDWDSARSQLGVIQVDMKALRGELQKLKNNIAGTAKYDAQLIGEKIDSMRLIIMLCVASILGVAVVVFYFSQNTIVNPIRQLSRQLDEIALHKDLRKPIDIQSADEIGTAGKSVNELLAAFSLVTADVRESSSHVFKLVSTLSDSASLSDEQVVSFSHHVSQMLEIISTLEESIDDSAQRSTSASEIARTGADQVNEGSKSVQLTASSISSLAKDIEASSEMLLNLKNAGDQVGSVVSTIAEIAGQTNLLALNAAIEAARAGESGRGFAVVADEVRTLASRTHDSTHQINSILDTIVSSISTTVDAMDINKEKANQAVDLAETTVESLNLIQSTVVSLGKENHSLADSAQAAKSNASQMRTSVNAIQQSTEQVTQSSRNTREASDNLNDQAVTLNDVAERFQI